MPHRQQHRGKHPEDEILFAEDRVPVLRKAVVDLSFLLGRGYASDPALAIVGDHYQLAIRQRRAVSRAACADAAAEHRRQRRAVPAGLRNAHVAIDGYNVLITIESLLGGGILIRGCDGCIRDVASIHGSYRCVEETLPAIALAGEVLKQLGVARAEWLLDAPVSNSGRLKGLLLEQARIRGWPWEVRLSANVDAELAQSGGIVATADGWILERAARWVNLPGYAIEHLGRPVPVVDLAAAS